MRYQMYLVSCLVHNLLLFSHVVSLLSSHHWLPVAARIKSLCIPDIQIDQQKSTHPDSKLHTSQKLRPSASPCLDAWTCSQQEFWLCRHPCLSLSGVKHLDSFCKVRRNNSTTQSRNSVTTQKVNVTVCPVMFYFFYTAAVCQHQELFFIFLLIHFWMHVCKTSYHQVITSFSFFTLLKLRRPKKNHTLSCYQENIKRQNSSVFDY